MRRRRKLGSLREAGRRPSPSFALPWMTGNPTPSTRASARSRVTASARGARRSASTSAGERPAAVRARTRACPLERRRRRNELSGLVPGDPEDRRHAHERRRSREFYAFHQHGDLAAGELARACRAQPLREDPDRPARRQLRPVEPDLHDAHPAISHGVARRGRRGRHDGRANATTPALHELTPGIRVRGTAAARGTQRRHAGRPLPRLRLQRLGLRQRHPPRLDRRPPGVRPPDDGAAEDADGHGRDLAASRGTSSRTAPRGEPSCSTAPTPATTEEEAATTHRDDSRPGCHRRCARPRRPQPRSTCGTAAGRTGASTGRSCRSSSEPKPTTTPLRFRAQPFPIQYRETELPQDALPAGRVRRSARPAAGRHRLEPSLLRPGSRRRAG